jgi:anti-anti-sigma regulatory factor
MTREHATQVIATRVRSCLIVTLPPDLLPELIDEVRHVTLEGLHRGGSQVVVFELSAVQVMDREDFESLQAITAMARLLGARPMWVGLRAGIVMHLVESDVDTGDVEAVRDLEEALARADADAREAADDEDAEDAQDAGAGDTPDDRAGGVWPRLTGVAP